MIFEVDKMPILWHYLSKEIEYYLLFMTGERRECKN